MGLFMQKRSVLMAALSAILAMALTGCHATKKDDTQQAQEQEVEQTLGEEGPHAAADRPLAKRVIKSHDGIHHVEIDFGNVVQGKYSTPARGILIAPTHAQTPTPVIVISHLRSPNCADKSSAYPCADGAEIRYDQGMSYLGEHLARQGYTVIIPDLGGVFIGADVTTPYDQGKMWQEVVGRFVDAIKTDLQGTTDTFGVDIAPVDWTKVGFFAHSRSGQMVDAAQQLFGKDNLKSVFAYAPAYDTIELEFISPVPADVPYLAVVGSLDADVGSSANLWLGHYASTPRQSPASVVELPGLGHMYVNRATSQIGFDDRIGCDVLDCLDDKEHERVMLQTASTWFDDTLRGINSVLPMTNSQVLPSQVAGLSAHWLSLTPKAIGFVEPKDWVDVQSGKEVMVCVHADPMNPMRPKNACPEPDRGFVQILTPVARLSGVSSAKTQIQGARGVSLQLAPTGSHQGVQGTAVSLTLHTTGGSTTIELPADHPALISRQSEQDNGTYRLGTVRVPLPPDITKETITQITLDPKHPIYVRSVDFW